MRTGLAIIVVAGLASGAQAQVFEVVITPDPASPFWYDGSFDYSVYLDNTQGPGFADFFGWSSFAGRMRVTGAEGTFVVPVETATQSSGGAWEGRRPPSTVGFPGGSAGGFRFSPQTYTVSPDGLTLEGAPGQAFEGLAASVPIGGFLQDSSPRLEVFRGTFQLDSPPGFFSASIEFVPVDAAYFNDPSFSTTTIGVQGDMGVVPSYFAIVPTHSTLVPLALAGLYVRRRR